MSLLFSAQKDQGGFTIVELLIAITIFAIGLLAVAGMQITAIRGNSTANVLTTGTAVAEGILEEILSWDSAAPIFTVDNPNITWDFGTSGFSQPFVTIEGGGTFSAVYALDADYPIDGDLTKPVVNITRVQVAVTQQGTGRTVVLVGFKRRI